MQDSDWESFFWTLLLAVIFTWYSTSVHQNGSEKHWIMFYVCCWQLAALTRRTLAMMEYSKQESVRVSMGGMVQGGTPYSCSSTTARTSSSFTRYNTNSPGTNVSSVIRPLVTRIVELKFHPVAFYYLL